MGSNTDTQSPPVQHTHAGLWWPAADPGKLRDAARAWRDIGNALKRVEGTADAAARTLLAGNHGPAMDAFQTYWSKWSDSSGYLAASAQACLAMADALDKYADAVDKARGKVEELIVEVGTAVVIGIGLSILTVGISDVAAGAVAGGLVAAAAAIGVDVSATVASIVATVVVGATIGAVDAAAIDAFAIQPEKMFIFHDQKDFSWSEVGQWAEMGALGGGIGGGISSGLSAGADALPDTVAAFTATTGGRMVIGGLTGLGSSAAVDEVTTGSVNPLDLAAGTVGGIAGGGLTHSEEVTPDLTDPNAPQGILADLRPPNPNMNIDPSERILFGPDDGLQTRTSGLFDDVQPGTPGAPGEPDRYLWTIDDRGVNLALEHSPWPTPRTWLTHTNLSPEASVAGEAWFGPGPDDVTINANSGRFGQWGGATPEQYQAAISYWEHLGYHVRVIPFGQNY